MRSTLASRLLPFAFLAVALVLHLRLALAPGGALAAASLLDTDSYTRLLRVIQLWQGGGWFDNVVYRLGAPEGMPLHWTRPLDLLIIGPAMVLRGFGLADGPALWWAAMFVCPVLHALSCLVAVWAARALWPRDAAWFAGLVLLAQESVLGYGAVGRADHHVLILLLGVAAIGALLRAAIDPAARVMAVAGGVLGGLGLWIGPEALIILVPALAAFGLIFVFDRAEGLAMARQGLRASLGFTMAVALALAVDVAPSAYLTAQSDRVSILHLVLGLAMASVFGAGILAGGRGGAGRLRRLLAGGAAAVVAVGLLSLLFPGFYRSSLAIDDPVMNRVLGLIAEMQPLRFWTQAGLADLLTGVGGTLLGLVVLPLALRRGPDGRARRALFLLLLILVASFGATLAFRRFVVEYAAAGAIATAGAMAFAGFGLARLRPLARAAGLLVVAFAGTVLLPTLGRDIVPPTTAPAACDRDALARFLIERRGGAGQAPDDPVVLIDNIDLAPALAFKTPFRFVGAPYHRGLGPMRDTVDFFATTDDSVARGILARRKVALVVLCRGAPGLRNDAPASIGARLAADTAVPAFLRVVASPEDLSRDFAIFSVGGDLATAR